MASYQPSHKPLCESLSIKSFNQPRQSQDDLETKLRQAGQTSTSSAAKRGQTECEKELRENYEFFMGNMVSVNDVPDAANSLMARNYPDLFEVGNGPSGGTILKRKDPTAKIQISVPDIFLKEEHQGAKMVEVTSAKRIKIDAQLLNKELNYTGALTETTVDGGNTYLQGPSERKMRTDNTVWGEYLKFYGDVIEMKIYGHLKLKLEKSGDDFGLFHSLDLSKLDLFNQQTLPGGNPRFLMEKDLVIVNKTQRYVMVVSVKRSLNEKGKNPTKTVVAKIPKEIEDARIRLESWFATEIDTSWKFIPVIFCEDLDANLSPFCTGCPKNFTGHNHIIKGALLNINFSN